MSQGEGFHHLGVWTPPHEVLSVTERYEMLHPEYLIPNEVNGRTTTKTDPTCLHGIRLELVDARNRPALEAWISGSVASPRET